jgi:hypothetical protein
MVLEKNKEGDSSGSNFDGVFIYGLRNQLLENQIIKR